MKLDEIVHSVIPDPDEYLVGYADMADLLAPAYRPYRFAVVVGRKLNDDIINSIQTGPTPQYFALYHRVNQELTSVLNDMACVLSDERINSLPISPTVSDDQLTKDFLNTLRLDFSHKMVATRAGLGWIGKSDLLITRKFGPRLRLASILVDYPIPNAGIPIEENLCGRCETCVRACPAQAMTGRGWRAGMDRGELYDAFKCRKQCRELSHNLLGEAISLCGICVSVCPVGKTGRPS